MKNLFINYDFSKLYTKELNESLDNNELFGPLSTSRVFQLADASAKGESKLSVLLPKVVSDSHGFIHVKYSDLSNEFIYDMFDSKTYKMKNKNEVKNAIISGKLVLVYSDKIKAPSSIPFIIRKMDKNDSMVYVIMSNCTNMNKEGKLECAYRKEATVMSLLYAAYIAYRISSQDNFNINAALFKTMAITYGGMFATVISYTSSIADPIMTTKLKYLGSRFFAVQSYGTEAGDDMSYRLLNPYYENKMASKMIIQNLDSQFPSDCFDNIELLFQKMIETYPNIKNLNLSSFIEAWVKRYGPSTTMAIDYVGYMLYVIISIRLGSPDVNIRSLDSVVSNELADAFEWMERL